MFIVVPSLDFRNRQGHNSDALLGGEIRSNEASSGHFGHGTRRLREPSETHPLTFRCLRGFLGPPSTRVHGSPFHLVVPVHRPPRFVCRRIRIRDPKLGIGIEGTRTGRRGNRVTVALATLPASTTASRLSSIPSPMSGTSSETSTVRPGHMGDRS